MPTTNRLLIIDDDPNFYEAFIDLFVDEYDVAFASTAAGGLKWLEEGEWLAVILDLSITQNHSYGIQHTLPVSVKRAENRFPVIVVTSDAERSIRNAVFANGASGLITKDIFTPEKLHGLIQQLVEKFNAEQQANIRQESTIPFMGQSGIILDVKRRLEVLSRKRYWEFPVLITGETGVGKDIAVRYLHQCKGAPELPFEEINLSVFQGDLFRSELYGHVKGVFAGAERDKIGLFTLAGRGTLFVDEIGEIDESTQVQLLKAIEYRTYKPIGGTQDLHLEAQLVFATNRDLPEAVNEGSFRADFYERIGTYPVSIPPLRERREDILPLIQYFLAKLEKSPLEMYSDLKGRFTKEVLEAMQAYYWPNNVRELSNTVRNLVFEAEVRRAKIIDASMLPHSFFVSHSKNRESYPTLLTGNDSTQALIQVSQKIKESAVNWPLDKQIAYEELSQIEQALVREGGRKEDAAKRLGLKSDQTLRYRVLKKYWPAYPELFNSFPIICKAYKLTVVN